MFTISFYIFSSFLSYSDCKKFLVPNTTLIAMAILMLIFGIYESKIDLGSIVLVLAVLLFFVIILFLKPTMILGGGDIKYMMVVVLYLGVQPFALFLVVTGLLQTFVLLYKQKIKRRRVAPMVPVMFVSTIIVDILVIQEIYPFKF